MPDGDVPLLTYARPPQDGGLARTALRMGVGSVLCLVGAAAVAMTIGAEVGLFTMLAAGLFGVAAVVTAVAALATTPRVLPDVRRTAWQGLAWGSIAPALAAAVLFTLPKLGRARPPAVAIRCASSLRSIGYELERYLDVYEKFPPDLEALRRHDPSVGDDLVCPSHAHFPPRGDEEAVLGRTLSYIYLVPPVAGDDAREAVAVELPGGHPETFGIAVLFGSGEVKRLPRAEAAALLRRAAEQGRVPAAALEALFLAGGTKP